MNVAKTETGEGEVFSLKLWKMGGLLSNSNPGSFSIDLDSGKPSKYLVDLGRGQ